MSPFHTAYVFSSALYRVFGPKCSLSLGDDDEDNDDDEVTILKYGTASTTNAWFE